MPEKFTLTVVGAEEDIPRMLLGHGRACGGEFTLVYRPREGESLLVHQAKKGPAHIWSTTVGAAPTQPGIEIAPAEAKAQLVRIKAGPPPRGPAMLRGQWRGWLFCSDAGVRIELERKLTSYGVLRVVSGAKGWTVTFDRHERWFSGAATKSIERASLAEALKAGYAEAHGIVGEACAVRDTHRRGAIDPVHAAKHPPKPPAERKDPTERYKPPAEKKPGGKKEAAPAPAAPRKAEPPAKKDSPKASCGGTCDHAPKKAAPPAAPKPIPRKAKPESTSVHTVVIDPKKDAQLMQLFSAGIRQAATEMGLT